MAKISKVVAAAILWGDKVLLASRPLGKSHAGYYEFPGGKQEVCESAGDALIRELDEELGIRVKHEDLHHLMSLTQNYADKQVELEVFIVKKWDGHIIAREGQELYWQEYNKVCELSLQLPTTSAILSKLSNFTDI